MLASRSSWAVLALMLAGLFGIVGCNDDNEPTGQISVAVTFDGMNFDTWECWVIVGDAEGDSVFDVERATEDGTIFLGSALPNRYTVTFAWASVYSDMRITSYVNTAQRHWLFDGIADQNLGQMALTVNYPAGDWERLRVYTSTGGFDNQVFGDTSWSTQTSVHHVENGNALSAVGIISGPSGKLCGWTVASPFLLGDTNSVAIVLDQPIPVHTITATRLLDELWVYGLRDETNPPYLFDVVNSSDAAAFDVGVPEFPVSSYWLAGANYTGEQYFLVWQKTAGSVPAMLTISDAIINANYDDELQAFQEITVQGPADAIWGLWEYHDFEYFLDWVVYAPRASMDISLPVIPDSLSVPIAEMQPACVGLNDFGPTDGFDGYVSIAAEGTAFHPEYLGLYQYVTYEGFDAPQSVRSKRMSLRPWMPSE